MKLTCLPAGFTDIWALWQLEVKIFSSRGPVVDLKAHRDFRMAL